MGALSDRAAPVAILRPTFANVDQCTRGAHLPPTGKIHKLHLAVQLILRWCACSRYSNRREVRQVGTMQFRMCRRALNFWATGEETLQMLMKRSARWCERVVQEASMPRWDAASIANWWRLAGQAARLAARQPDKWRSEALYGATPYTLTQSVRCKGARNGRRAAAARPRLPRCYEHALGRPSAGRTCRTLPIHYMSRSCARQ